MRILHRSTVAAALLVSACSDDGIPGAPGAIDRATAIAIVSGNGQQAKAGEPLDQPLVVRVTDSGGSGIPGVAVSFNVMSGMVALDSKPPGPPGAPMTLSVQTDPGGHAWVTVEPYELGPISVEARVAGARLTPVAFTAHASVMVIQFVSTRSAPYAGFIGPCGVGRGGQCFDAVTVPVGTTVEWKTLEQVEYTVTSTSTPRGGAAFDSGPLTSDRRFRFTPEASGTWEYRDQLTGLAAALNAR